MIDDVRLVDAPLRHLAAVAARAERNELATAIRSSLDKVYAVLRARNVEGLGHNIVFYRDPASGLPFDLEIGVETPSPIAPEGEVRNVDLPVGRAAVVAYWGSYDKIGEGHGAVQGWLAERGLKWRDNVEVYGDWAEDPSKLRTDLVYMLADGA